MAPGLTKRSETLRSLTVNEERWLLRSPLHITGYTFEEIRVLLVSLQADGCVGRGEAAGVYYRGDDCARMRTQIEALRESLENELTRESLQHLLPPGGARNALDCALWELEAKQAHRAAWQIAGLSAPKRLLTTVTLGAGQPDKMAEDARAASSARALKLKLTGEPTDLDRVRAVRAARPDVWLGVDANQAWTRSALEQLLPALVAADVRLIEQPCRIGREVDLDGLASPIPIAADESAQSIADLAGLLGRFQAVNIKLDKCGGLTAALAMAREARRLGLDVMVGNMGGTSLAMAPAFLVGQLSQIVDLDGPLFLSDDRSPAVTYECGELWSPEEIWGGSSAEFSDDH